MIGFTPEDNTIFSHSDLTMGKQIVKTQLNDLEYGS